MSIKTSFYSLLLIFCLFLITKINADDKHHNTPSCVKSSDCRNFYSCVNGYCLHKSFYSPFTASEVVLSNLVGIVSGLCMAVGVGGGIFYIPLLSTLGSFYIKEVVPISNFLICITSFVTFIYNLFQVHPKLAFRGIIDFNLAFTLLPPLFIGVNIGYYINMVSPNILLFSMLVMIFIYLNYSVISKLMRVLQEKKDNETNENPDNEALINDDKKGESTNSHQIDNRLKIEDEETMKTIQCYFLWKIFFIVLTLSFYVIFNYLTGIAGNTPIINLRDCSVSSMIIFISFVTLVLLTSFLIIKYWRLEKEAIATKIFFKDVELNCPNITCIMIVGFVAGVASSALGLGAGTIINPILIGTLENYSPTVISATTVFLMLIVSSYGTIVFIHNGQLDMEYAAIISITCIIGTILGLLAVRAIMNKMKNESIIVYLLVFLVGFSSILLLTSGIIDVLHVAQKNPKDLFRFGHFCRK